MAPAMGATATPEVTMYDEFDVEEAKDPQAKRPPWWFVSAIWAGIAGTAAALAAAVGLSSQ